MDIEPRVTLAEIALFAGRWVTVKHLAEKFKVHPDTIRRWANQGRIKHIRHPINNYHLFLDPEFLEVTNCE